MSRAQERLLETIDQMTPVCVDTGAFIADMTADDFRSDIVKQRAISMNLMIIGGAASDILKRNPEFAADHPDLGLSGLVDLRNHILQDLSNFDPKALWVAASRTVPQLLAQLRALRHIHAQGE
ncbi:HepT-like ribonuclease domain-containing protein [Rhizobium sp. FKY42]|uniref:HepT-like ribonuclease domain-containing protein n=1 Tax=Rhizobium sp. FKY42 TaxID=2562310 RepID=UPI0010C0F57F|nr:HepT-like ribonuclease domain-containing protein [Rhizobium sp. FKY42]